MSSTSVTSTTGPLVALLYPDTVCVSAAPTVVLAGTSTAAVTGRVAFHPVALNVKAAGAWLTALFVWVEVDEYRHHPAWSSVTDCPTVTPVTGPVDSVDSTTVYVALTVTACAVFQFVALNSRTLRLWAGVRVGLQRRVPARRRHRPGVVRRYPYHHGPRRLSLEMRSVIGVGLLRQRRRLATIAALSSVTCTATFTVTALS